MMKHRLRRLERAAAARWVVRHPPQVCVVCTHASDDPRPVGVHPTPTRPAHVDVVFGGNHPDPAVFAALERDGRLQAGGYKVIILGPDPGGGSL